MLLSTLAPAEPGQERLRHYGVPRLVRDLSTVSGRVEFGADASATRITLNRAAPLARYCLKAFHRLLKPHHVHVILGET